MKALLNLGVNTKLGTKVNASHELSDHGQEVSLSDGDIIKADLYIPTFGLIPNSSYMPAQYLNAKDFVMVDESLKVVGANDIWAIGDVSDVEAAQFISCDRQSVYLAKALTLALSNKATLPYKVASSRMFSSPLLLTRTTRLTIYRIHGLADRQESWDRPLWEHETSRLHVRVGEEDAVYREHERDG